jgi:hypothetical protein
MRQKPSTQIPLLVHATPGIVSGHAVFGHDGGVGAGVFVVDVDRVVVVGFGVGCGVGFGVGAGVGLWVGAGDGCGVG